MIKPRGKWFFFQVIKLKKFGTITLLDGKEMQKEEVVILAIGKDVKELKAGQKVVLHPNNVIQYKDPESPEDFRGFALEENAVAIVDEDKVREN